MAEKIAAANAIFDDSELKRIIREKYSYGHPAFNDLMISQMKLHSEKNKLYAGGGSPLGNFTRNANIMKNYPSFPYHTPEGFLMMLVMKHIDAILWSLNTGRKPPEDACQDVGVYVGGILRCMLLDG
jgi:hypothetical protein